MPAKGCDSSVGGTWGRAVGGGGTTRVSPSFWWPISALAGMPATSWKALFAVSRKPCGLGFSLGWWDVSLAVAAGQSSFRNHRPFLRVLTDASVVSF